MAEAKTKEEERVVRFDGKVRKARVEKEAFRSLEELLLQAEEKSVAEVATSLTGAELMVLIDSGAVLDGELKKMKARLDTVKELLRVNAEENQWKEMAGNVAHARVGPSTGMNIEPGPMAKLLAKLKKSNLFESVFSVKVTEAKKYVGMDDLEEIAEIETKEYSRVTLKLLK